MVRILECILAPVANHHLMAARDVSPDLVSKLTIPAWWKPERQQFGVTGTYPRLGHPKPAGLEMGLEDLRVGLDSNCGPHANGFIG